MSNTIFIINNGNPVFSMKGDSISISIGQIISFASIPGDFKVIAIKAIFDDINYTYTSFVTIEKEI